MGPSRNAPCPCGSGSKYKRCCAGRAHERAVAVRHEERVGREAEAWAFATFGDELVAAGRALVARLQGAQAGWVGEHWVMLDCHLRGGGTAAERYAALGQLDAADQAIARRIARSRVGVHRIAASRPGDGMDLVDALGGTQVTVASPSVSRTARTGDTLVARMMDGPVTSLWGPSRVFSPQEAGPLLDAAAQLGGRSGGATLRQHWPALMTFDTRRPTVITTAEWDIDDAEAVLDRLPDAFEYDRSVDGADVLQWHLAGTGETWGGSVELYADGIVARSYAESTMDELIAVLDDALGPLSRFDGRSSVPFDAVAFDSLDSLAA